MFSIEKQIEVWNKVAHDTALLETVAHTDVLHVNAIATLRKKWSAEELSVAIELIRARASAMGRLENAETVISDLEGVQQTSSSAVAKWKAKRFATCEHVVDLCCGIGGDLLHLPEHTVGVEIRPLRCWMAQQNSAKKVDCCDVRTYTVLKDALVLLDPSRRDTNGRRLTLEEMQPPLSTVQEICNKVRGGCVKLSPAINLEDVTDIGEQQEVEYIEDRGRVTQGVVWFNDLVQADCEVTATSLSKGQTFSGYAETPRIFGEFSKWIFEPNTALERAKLHGTLANELDFWEPAFGLGLLCGHEFNESNWFTAFEVLKTTTLRIEKVSAALRTLNAGEVEVKTRGGVVDPDVWQKKLQKPASDLNERLTVFALRAGKKRVAVITRRVKQ
jgi:hypothetical protein